MGNVFVFQEDGKLIVVDGQQRITTTIMILAAARIVAHSQKNAELIK